MNEPVKDVRYFVDIPAQERFRFVLGKGKEIFEGSALVDPSKKIGRDDIDRIAAFHKAVAPTNPSNPWRLTQEDRWPEKDPSSFGNWEAPGGPLEHITLAGRAAEIITRDLQDHLRSFEEGSEDGAIVEKLKNIDPLHAAAAAALHDEGREVNHIFYTNELIGRGLLVRIGIRDDILAVLPNEEIMWLPQNVDVDVAIRELSPEQVIVRIADDYGKRKTGTNRLMQRDDFTQKNQEMWAEGYMDRPDTGRPSDRLMRSKMHLHTQNAQRYLDALDKWVRSVSTLTIDDLIKMISAEFSPTLSQIPDSADIKK